MSLHLGVVRIGWQAVQLIDVLFDTTDSDSNLAAFCNIQYDKSIGQLVSALAQSGHLDFDVGVPVPAY